MSEVVIDSENLDTVVDAHDVVLAKPTDPYTPKPKRAKLKARTQIGEHDVRYLYFGDVRTNVDHGGIVCAAVVVIKTVIHVGLALVPNYIPEPYGTRKRFHRYEKSVVRDIAWLRLNHALTGIWDEGCENGIISASTIDFKVSPAGTAKIDIDALRANKTLTIAPHHESGDNSDLDLEIEEDLRDTQNVDEIITSHLHNASVAGNLPRWVCGLSHCSLYRDLASFDEGDDLEEHNMPVKVDEFAYHALRVVTGSREDAGVDPTHAPDVEEWHTVAEVYFDAERKPLDFEPLTDWYQSLDELHHDLLEQLDAVAHAEAHGTLSIDDVDSNTSTADVGADLEGLDDETGEDLDGLKFT